MQGKERNRAMNDSSFNRRQVLAGLRPRLLTDAETLPGSRILDGQFTAVQQAIGTARAKTAGAAFLRGREQRR